MLNESAEQALKSLLSHQQIITDPVELLTYEVDAAHDSGTPDAVVFPENSEDVCKLVTWAGEHHVPLIARGAGTGLSGGAVAHQGGVILAFSHMKQIIEFDSIGRRALVEPGLVNLVLDELVKTKGLYYPPDPASGRTSTLGGNLAENAGGPHCFKYGVTTNYITGMEVVLADGQIARIGGAALDYPEYDLGGLITGSEGTLGIITKINLRLIGYPPGVKTLMATFDSIEQAGIAVSAVIAAGLVPAAMEMMDQKIIRIIEDYAHPGLPTDAGALLIVDVDGYPNSLNNQVKEILQYLESFGGHDIRIALSNAEREKIWFARKSAAGAIARLAPAYYLVDGTVPRSRLAEALSASNRICEEYDLQVGYVFHAGDGNMHPLILMYPDDAEQVARVHQAGYEFLKQIIQLDGSITGEHGVGLEKRSFMSLMYNPVELGAMYDIKRAFDPKNTLNPGKIFPSDFQELHITPPSASTPIGIFTPETPEESSAGLAALSSANQPVYITGKERKNIEGNQPDRLILSTQRLSGIYDYAPNDLYITAGAGTTLVEIQDHLAKDGKYLPLVSPWSEVTIGGLLATNLNAPLRMRYGGLRDQLLALTVVLGDGRVVRAGRPVVKNVAGYDIPKVLIGSHGTLGLITEATFKISVQPRAIKSLVYPIEKIEQSLTWATTSLSQALVASAVMLCRGITAPAFPGLTDLETPTFLIYTAEGLPEDVEVELSAVQEKLSKNDAPEPILAKDVAGSDMWAKFIGINSTGILKIRTGVSPKDLPTYLLKCTKSLAVSAYIADFANGMLYASANPDGVGEAQAWVDELRKPALSAGGYTVILEAPSEWLEKLDIWGYRPNTLHIMQTLKKHWDPDGILNPGYFLNL